MKVSFRARTLLVLTALVSLGAAAAAHAGEWTLFGDATVIKLGRKQFAFRLDSAGSEPSTQTYGGMEFVPTRAIRFGQLNTLSADYFAVDGVGGGTPRFSIGLDVNGDGQFVQAPQPDGSWGPDGHLFVGPGDLAAGYTSPPSTEWQNTGNYINLSGDYRWDAGQVAANWNPPNAYYNTYANVLNLNDRLGLGRKVRQMQVMYVLWVVDGGWFFGEQEVLCNNIAIHNAVLKAKP